MYRAHKSTTTPRTELQRRRESIRSVQDQRVLQKTLDTHQRIRRRVQEAAAEFGLDPLDEEAWLLEADYHRTNRLQGESLGGLCAYVRTMMGLRSAMSLASPELRDYHDGANRLDPGPENQAPSIARHQVKQLCQMVPFPQALCFWLMWKTASRAGDVIGLQGKHLHWDRNSPHEFGITWLKLTKLGKKHPYAVRNTTHVIVEASDPWQMRCLKHLKSVKDQQYVHPFRTWSQMSLVLKRLPPPLSSLRPHSFKVGAADECNKLVTTEVTDLPEWVPSLLLKHDNIADKIFPPQSVRYAHNNPLLLIRRTKTGFLTVHL